jgi:pyruvate kinase
VRTDEHYHFTLAGSKGAIPLPHPEVFAAVASGDTLSCDDDRLRFRIVRVTSGAIETISLSDGTLRPRKGVNVVEHPVNLEDLCADDLACIRAAADLRPVAFAFSFMKDGSEAEWVRRRAPGCRVIGKIERREATASAHRAAGAMDELWICRGDLGAQLGPAAMARWVSGYDPRCAPCPVLMAGQVIEHLTQHSTPTRAEVCHLFDLVCRGYAGFVLSDETAIGADPAGAVRSLRNLLTEFRAAG